MTASPVSDTKAIQYGPSFSHSHLGRVRLGYGRGAGKNGPRRASILSAALATTRRKFLTASGRSKPA
jgi:hypothetical protein